MARLPTYPSARPTMDTRILLALRAGPLTMQQLTDRLGIKVSMSSALAKGWVAIRTSGVLGMAQEYHLTAAGRAACPRWRDVCKSEAVLDGALA